MTKQKKQSIPIGPLKIVERPPEPEYRKTTPQDIAEILGIHLKSLNKLTMEYANRQNDPKLGALYNHYRQLLSRLGDNLPVLILDDFYSGLTRLAEYCQTATQGKPEPKNLMVVSIIPQYFDITIRTIHRWIKKEQIVGYPDVNGLMKVDAVEIAKYAKRRAN